MGLLYVHRFRWNAKLPISSLVLPMPMEPILRRINLQCYRDAALVGQHIRNRTFSKTGANPTIASYNASVVCT
jgi:hypothetical protein